MVSRNEAYQKEKDEINKARAAEDAYVSGDFYHEEVRCANLQFCNCIGDWPPRQLGPPQLCLCTAFRWSQGRSQVVQAKHADLGYYIFPLDRTSPPSFAMRQKHEVRQDTWRGSISAQPHYTMLVCCALAVS